MKNKDPFRLLQDAEDVLRKIAKSHSDEPHDLFMEAASLVADAFSKTVEAMAVSARAASAKAGDSAKS